MCKRFPKNYANKKLSLIFKESFFIEILEKKAMGKFLGLWKNGVRIISALVLRSDYLIADVRNS